MVIIHLRGLQQATIMKIIIMIRESTYRHSRDPSMGKGAEQLIPLSDSATSTPYVVYHLLFLSRTQTMHVSKSHITFFRQYLIAGMSFRAGQLL